MKLPTSAQPQGVVAVIAPAAGHANREHLSSRRFRDRREHREHPGRG